MKIRDFQLKDFVELCMMYRELTREIYPNRKLGEDYFFARTVINWIQAGNHIVICEASNGEVVGFTVSRIDDMAGVTEPVYFGDIAYVKPNYRKTKAAYLLYHNVCKKADELGLILYAHAYIGGDNKVDKIQKKLGGKPVFIAMEREVI